MSSNSIKEAVVMAKEKAPERNFTESVDVSISVQDIDLSDPSKRFRAEVLLPNEMGKDIIICVIGDEALIQRAKETEGIQYTLDENQLEQLARESNKAVTLAEEVDYFLALPDFMADVGRLLGRFLGPRGKMPTVLPPSAPLDQFVERYNRTTRLDLRQNPVINTRIGTADMSDDELVANVRTVINEVESRLEQGRNQLRRVFVKTTMGPSIEIGY